MKRIMSALYALGFLAFSASAQVVVTEIHYHPIEEPAFNADGTPYLDLTDDVHEFIEIQNTGPTTVDLSNWTLAGGIGYSFPSGTTIAAGAWRVICPNPARLSTVYSLVESEVLGPYSGQLSNSSDTVRLKDASGATVDSVTYNSKFPWAQTPDALGAQDRFVGLTSSDYQYKGVSLQRVSVTWPANDPANWLASPLTGPTPGGPQAVTRTVPKPVVTSFSALQTSDGATIIRPNAAATVNCAFSDTTDLSQVTLEYFVDNMNSTTETRTPIVMTELGNGRYTAAIPGQATRTIVRYRFKANRGDGLEVVSPRADEPQIAPVGAGGTLEAWHGYFVTPVRSSSNAAIYDVLISTTGLSAMSTNITQYPKRVTIAGATGQPREVPYVASTAPQWNGTVPAVFACNGELWDIHIRYHGSVYHRSPSTHSYKLHFPDHHPLNDQTAWFDTLHGTEFIEAQKINRLLGLPSSRMRRVDWYLNSASNEVHSEQGEYAGEMLDAWHELQQQLNPGSEKEENGELYKDVGNRDVSQNSTEGPYTRGDEAPLAANSGWTQLQRYDWTFSLQNNGWKGSKPIRDLIEGMWAARGDSPSTHNFSSDSTKLANAKAWMTANFDMDRLLTSFALLQWMSIWDDAAQNHFFWRRANGKWVRLGWDYDNVMSTGGGGGGMGGGTSQTIYGGEYGATNVFDGVNWFKDTFFKCFRTEYNQRLWELNNSFFEQANLTAQGLTKAASFAAARKTYINTTLSTLGTYYKPARPTNASPANGASIVSATDMSTSVYSHPQSAAHQSTRWEIRNAAGDYEEPVLSVTTTENLTSYPIPFDQLTYGSTYYWRATHIDVNGHPSIVSAETSFTWGSSNSGAGTLVMNELLAHNRNTVESGGEYPDYIELYNNGTTTVTLSGHTLTDDPATPAKYAFPADATIAAGAYLLVWCDKDYATPGLHSGFNLSTAGETVILMKGADVIDSVNFGPQAPDVSIGRIVNGTGGWQANTPTPGTSNSAKTLGSVASLRINEWMADPASGDDWFEIHNTDANVVAMGGLYLSDSVSTPKLTQIPVLSFIEGKGHTKFLADDDSTGSNHCAFKLGKSGDNIILTATNGSSIIDYTTFASQALDVSQGRLPDGASAIVSFASQTASPGAFNWAPAPVYINELLANAAWPFEDAIEIRNPTAGSVSIGGWWISDDTMDRMKYQVPAGTTVPANGYLAIYASQLGAGTTPVAFNAKGDEAILSAVDGTGKLTGYGSFVRFGASAENVSFGRVAATGLSPSSGGAEFWPQMTRTFGQDEPATTEAFRTGTGLANGKPVIGPVVINEIMYHPTDFAGAVDNTRDEFIELLNITGSPLNIGNWRVKGDIEYEFPVGTVLPAGGSILVVGFDPANTAVLSAFSASYGLSGGVPVYGPFSPNLANSTNSVEVAYPAAIGGYTRHVNVDKVEYRDSSPWPTTADGSGYSLQRISASVIGNTAANWNGAAPTPGAANAVSAFSLADVVNALRYAGGLSSLPSTYKSRYDAVSNGTVNLSDAIRIARKAAGLEANP